MNNDVKDMLYAIKNCLENEGASRCYICPYAHLLSDCMTSMLSDSSEYIQQLEDHVRELTKKIEQLEAAQVEFYNDAINAFDWGGNDELQN